jgi:hypothetical protein
LEKEKGEERRERELERKRGHAEVIREARK